MSGLREAANGYIDGQNLALSHENAIKDGRIAEKL